RIFVRLTQTLADEPSPVPGGISEARNRFTERSPPNSLRTARGISRALPRPSIRAISCNLARAPFFQNCIKGLVDRSTENPTAEALVVGRQVRPPASKTDANRA